MVDGAKADGLGCWDCKGKDPNCQTCIARAFWDNGFREYLEVNNIDPRERRYWRLIRHEAPARPERRFIPEEEYRAMLDAKKRQAKEAISE